MNAHFRAPLLLLGALVLLIGCDAAGPSGLESTPATFGAGGGLTGAIFTTNSTCTGVNFNVQYNSRLEVYLNGGPQKRPGAAGLPDGDYYVQITSPMGTLLGTSVGTTDETPVHVTGGEFDDCYQLWAILRQASTDVSGGPVAPDGYELTDNNGGEYKVWVSKSPDFVESVSKTDNFKVRDEECTDDCGPDPEQPRLNVLKYYDANANSMRDPGESLIEGWKVNVTDGISEDFYTSLLNLLVEPDDYVVTEYSPVETNWFHTDPATAPYNKSVTIANGDDKTVEFGNVCIGGGTESRTIGYWQNKQGNDLAALNKLGLQALNLRNANGSHYNPADFNWNRNATGSWRQWLSSANASNMAYMLSAQMAGTWLNKATGKLVGTELVYAPGATSASPLGFATINALLTEANTFLGVSNTSGDKLVLVAAGASRTYAEALKNAFDNANNNRSFVQGSPCPFSFAE